jgi:hypothetical protein
VEPFNYSSSYEDFLARMRVNLRDQNVSQDIYTLLKNGFEKALNAQNIVLSRQERARSFQVLSKEILSELTDRF